jgi:hypothetical protein
MQMVGLSAYIAESASGFTLDTAITGLAISAE